MADTSDKPSIDEKEEEEEIAQDETLAEKINRKVKQYYKKHNAPYDDEFEKWCDDNGYDDEGIKEDLGLTSEESTIVEFETDMDNPFPFEKNKDLDDDQKRDMIFKLLKAWHDDRDEFFIDDFEFNTTEKELLETYKLYKDNGYVKTWAANNSDTTQLTDINILYFITISLKNRSNLLINLVDAYKRYSLDMILEDIRKNDKEDKDKSVTQYSTNAESERRKKWINGSLFLKALAKQVEKIKLNAAEIERGLTETKNPNNVDYKKAKLDLDSIIKVYPRRIGPRLQPRARLIDDDLGLISRYIVASAIFIDKIVKKEAKKQGGFPCQVDVMILLNPTVESDTFASTDVKEEYDDDDDDDDDSEDEYGPISQPMNSSIVYKHDIIQDLEPGLKINGCKFVMDQIDDNIQNTADDPDDIAGRCEKVVYNEFYTKLDDEDVAGDKFQYPQNKRLNFVFDRRDFYKKGKNEKDYVILFTPPANCSTVPSDHVPEVFFDLSRMCLIPREGYMEDPLKTEPKQYKDKDGVPAKVWELRDESINATSAAQGQVLTFSYHIWAADEIKCYLLWQGQCHRFYPQDIVDVLPSLFVKNDKNIKFAGSDEAKRLANQMNSFVPDEKFERFYRGVSRMKKGEFPHKYNVSAPDVTHELPKTAYDQQ